MSLQYVLLAVAFCCACIAMVIEITSEKPRTKETYNNTIDVGKGLGDAVQREPRLPPWTVVCDEDSGKWSFIRFDGCLWIEEFDTRQAATARMEDIKQIDEQTDADLARDRQAMEAIKKKKWRACIVPIATEPTSATENKPQ
jgi:hypothetical protein